MSNNNRIWPIPHCTIRCFVLITIFNTSQLLVIVSYPAHQKEQQSALYIYIVLWKRNDFPFPKKHTIFQEWQSNFCFKDLWFLWISPFIYSFADSSHNKIEKQLPQVKDFFIYCSKKGIKCIFIITAFLVLRRKNQKFALKLRWLFSFWHRNIICSPLRSQII